jgi:hypothetical protein
LPLIGSRTVYADNGTLILPLTWVGRSAETPSSVPFSDMLGGAVDAGLALALNPNEVVFDNGRYTPDANKEATPEGNEWASWPQWHGFCSQTFEVRHFRATFNLPTEFGVARDLILFSPFYTAHGDIIPINDNAYVFLNGTFIGQKGASYGARNGGFGGTVPFANEVGGWFQEGRFGATAAVAAVTTYGSGGWPGAWARRKRETAPSQPRTNQTANRLDQFESCLRDRGRSESSRRDPRCPSRPCSSIIQPP